MADEPDPLTQLEERYCHQSKLLEDLSDVLYAQQRSIDTLELRVKRLEDQLAAVLELVEERPPNERPPHY